MLVDTHLNIQWLLVAVSPFDLARILGWMFSKQANF